MESMFDRMEMPPAVNSLLSTPSMSQSVALGREPPTDREKGPRAATSLLGAEVKKLLGFVSAAVPGASVASCTKSRPFKGNSATCCELITCPSEGFEVSIATSEAVTSTVELTVDGDSEKSNSRCSSTCNFTSLLSVAWKPLNSTCIVYTETGSRLIV